MQGLNQSVNKIIITWVACVALLLFAVAAVLFAASYSYRSLVPEKLIVPAPLPAVTVSTPKIDQIIDLSHLVTNQIDITEVLIGEVPKKARDIWIVKGNAQIGVDLSKARFEKIDQINKIILISLPQPTVTMARVDLEKSRQIALEGTSYNPWDWGMEAESAAVEAIKKKAQRSIEKAAATPTHFERARKQTEGVVKRIYATSEYSVTIEWDQSAEDSVQPSVSLPGSK
jgi:hypothetical protein